MSRPIASSASARSSLAVLAPFYLSGYWVGTLLTQMLILGIVAASLIFLSAYGGMVSLAQVAVYGIAGFVVGNATTNGNTKGLNLGWSPWWGIVLALVITVVAGVALRRAREPQRRDLLPDDHAHVLGDREPDVRPGDRHLRLRRDQRHPGAVAASAPSTRTRTGSTTRRSSSRSPSTCCCATWRGRRSG